MLTESKLSARPAYRPDIDGLRAIAVVAAICFHAKVPGFGGGFVGVDVFFVISGYLITQVLSGASEQRPVQLLKWFYLRRCRRILPALLLVMLVVAVVGLVLMPPEDLMRMGRSLAINAVLLGNVASSRDGSYFGILQPLLPLSHLWSIAVEEQFYVAYPLVLLFMCGTGAARQLRMVVTLGAVSLVLCVLIGVLSRNQYYYLTPARAWELLLGAALALRRQQPAQRWYSGEAAAFLALAALLLVIALYRKTTPYPSLYTLVPCVATAVLINAGRIGTTTINRALAVSPLVFIGRISYSLYLWHRPVLSFFVFSKIVDPAGSELLLLLTLTLILSITSWYFVEQPFRQHQVLPGNGRFLGSMTTVMISLGLCGFVMWRTHGLQQRYTPEMRILLASVGDPRAIETRCILLSQTEVEAGKLCALAPDTRVRFHVLVWGDSHANALQPALRVLAAKWSASFALAARGACAPLLDIKYSPQSPIQRTGCPEFNAAMVRATFSTHPDLVILAGYWNLPPSELPPFTTNAAQAAEPTLTLGLRNMLSNLPAGIPVCVVLDVPELRIVPQYNLALALRAGWSDQELGLSHTQALQQQAFAEQSLRKLSDRSNLYFADLKEVLCAGATCKVIVNGKSLYHDNNHLSPTGSELVAPALAKCLEPLLTHES